MTPAEKKLLNSIARKLHKGKSKLPSDSLALLHFIDEHIDGLKKHDSSKTRAVSSQNKRINQILDVLMTISTLDFSKKAIITKNGDFIDGLAAGVNMMGEELKSSTVSLREKETLLKEVHHRVKNNLQLVQSLLNIQSNYIDDEFSNQKFKESIERVSSMALIHEKLYISTDLSRIDFNEYLRSLVSQLFVSYNINPDKIKVLFDIEDVHRFMDLNTAVPCGLMINEMLTNSFKYAFPDGKNGEIRLFFGSKSIGNQKWKNTIQVADNGIGLPKKFDPDEAQTLGMQLILTLVEQIDGKLEIMKNQGAGFIVSFVTDEKM